MPESTASAAPIGANAIRREVTQDQVCVLTFDRPDSAANIFDHATLVELGAQLDWVEAESQLRGVVFASAKDSIFIAGADLHGLMNLGTTGLEEMIRLGQQVFSRVAALRLPTVAAIHGACLGGGYELCLACDARVATDDRSTKIGLPETQLGILPAWGGSTRLPRLIGLPAALEVILAGKTLAAAKAFKLGMVDALTPREYLLESAWELVVNGKRPPAGSRRPSAARLCLLNNRLAARVIARSARAAVMKDTRGHYPAPLAALEVITRGLRRSIDASLALEANAVVELTQSDTTRHLVGIFFLQEKAKKLNVLPRGQRGEKPPKIQRAAVIGAGVMGAGIAQWLSARGVNVLLRDINADAVARGMARAAKLFAEGVRRRSFSATEARQAMDRIQPVATAVTMKNTELVIEAAVEKMELKEDIFHQLEDLTTRDTILATNTSALSVTALAADLLVPERVVGIHFFNPVHRMQLVEVIQGKRTAPEVLQRAVRFTQQIGRLPVVVKDSPGFVVNRILMPYLIEAARLFEQGAEVAEIDRAMLDFGMPMGPLRLVDEVGVDVAHHVCQTLARSFSRYLFVPTVLTKLIDRGWLGRKSGKGFYTHAGGKTRVNREDTRFLRDDRVANDGRGRLQSRMTLLMVNEAARCVEEEIVPGPADVDFAMIMGTGFAPFRGGPLRFADSFGVPRVVADMNQLAEQGELHFQPCELLKSMARASKTFYPGS